MKRPLRHVKYGAIHLVYPKGCAVAAAAHVEEIKNVYWRELGMPECLWVMKIKEFGPLIVSIDTEEITCSWTTRNITLPARRGALAPDY
ncbi:MAG: fumarate hydratase C-terminal domain-containing protein [Enterocloster bolteae]